MADSRIWSDNLGWELLSSLPDAELASQWGPITSAGGQGDLRRELVDWARQDEDVRHWIVRSWRETHADLVASADQVVIEGLTESALKALAPFPPEQALLALLTDEFDDGRELARTFLSRAEDAGLRRTLLVALSRLLGERDAAPRRRIRVAILGGHPRIEGRLTERLFADSPFEVRWRAFEKKPSSGVVQKGVVGLLCRADAAVIISGMASHMLVQFARGQAQRRGVPWRCVEKATDVQLKAALHEMFPETAAHWA
jgi:hypothetical protein